MTDCKECGVKMNSRGNLCEACIATDEIIDNSIKEESKWQSENPDPYGRW